MHAQSTFFHQGHELFKEFEPEMKNVASQVTRKYENVKHSLSQLFLISQDVWKNFDDLNNDETDKKTYFPLQQHLRDQSCDLSAVISYPIKTRSSQTLS